ncbi:MAG TPA: hypothetical protein VE093_39690 [Polyangiaceae bacterium]|nr:hypothetical protein [Polyangiaceae bacterium]
MGVEGFGLTAAEHLATRRDNPGQVNDYKNCVYICRLCNGARSTRVSVDRLGRCLLDPSKKAWAEHFDLKGIRLTPKSNDQDAVYTEKTYDINCRRKLEMRSKRAKFIADNIAALAEKAARIAQYLEIAQRLLAQDDAARREDVQFLLKEAQRVERDAASRRENLRHFLAIPRDADNVCDCGMVARLDLPSEYRRQVQRVVDGESTSDR